MENSNFALLVVVALLLFYVFYFHDPAGKKPSAAGCAVLPKTLEKRNALMRDLSGETVVI